MKIIHHVLIGRGLQFLKDKDVFPDASCLLGALFEDGRHAHLEASVDESSKGGNVSWSKLINIRSRFS